MSIKLTNCILCDGTGKRYIDDSKPMVNKDLDKLTDIIHKACGWYSYDSCREVAKALDKAGVIFNIK